MLRLTLIAVLVAASPALAGAQDAPMDAAVSDGGERGPSGLDSGVAEGGVPEGGVRAAAEPPPAPPRRALRVAVVGSPPFLLQAGSDPSGMSVDIWRELAERMDVDYELTVLHNATEAIEEIEADRYDLAIGPVSITSERLGHVEFTQPYFQSSLSILAPSGGAGVWERIEPFLSRAFFGGVAALLIVLTIVGTLLWLFERKASEQFPRAPMAGIGVGVWLALVTMTTVGYGDKAPTTLGGRLVTGVWMVIAMLTASSLTAGIATALTLSQLDESSISSAQELRGKSVAAVRGTTAASFARRYGARVVEVADVAAGLQALESEAVDALVHDRPVLQYHLRTHSDLELTLSSAEYEPQGYGFAVPLGEDGLRRELDIGLLGMEEEGRLGAIGARWL